MATAATQSPRKFGCSRCLIKAIERGERTRLEELLSSEHEFNDTFWAPLPDTDRAKNIRGLKELAPFPIGGIRIPRLTAECSTSRSGLASLFRSCFPYICIHRTSTDDHQLSLLSAERTHVAMSVVLTAMLYSTSQFNAFEKLVRSLKFDMNAPVKFHLDSG